MKSMTNLYETYEQMLSNPEYAKLFDNFSNEQAAIMKEHIRKFLLETEQKLSSFPAVPSSTGK